jgi:GMP synthase-like glutamine amidotransferase
MASCLVIQHVEPESAFAIADSLRAADAVVDVRRVFAGEPLPPDLSRFEGLVVMGGPMSAGSDDGFATRSQEIGLLSDALERGLPTLGVCLGAQLLAVAGGGSVAVGAAGPEVGWDTVSLLDGCRADALFGGLPETLTVLHWHAESFEIPPGGRRLMSSRRYANQAFALGDAAWGVQFHMEVTKEAVDGFVHAFGADAAGAPGGGARIGEATPAALAALDGPRRAVFDRFAGLVAARVSEGGLAASG